jgi:tRNA (cmo5U34)-methyltransferase
LDASHHTDHPAPGHDHGRHHEDWHDEDFIEGWLERQEERVAERRRQFAVIRALVPKKTEEEFRYLNIAAGPGNLDEVLLERSPNAQATLVDYSLVMLSVARQRLERFGDRVAYVQADLGRPEWAGAVKGPFDLAVSTLAVHDIGEPRRVRALYAEAYRLLAHHGLFLNLDYVRPARTSLTGLTAWAARDAEAGLSGRTGPIERLASLQEQLAWLTEAGFACVDVLWKELNAAVFCGVRDHLSVPDAGDGHGAEAGHSHAH